MTRRLWRWCAFITITSSSEQCWRKGPLVLVSRNFWTRQSHVASVEPSCNPAFWPQLGSSFALRCQSCFACELVFCHELQKLSILFSVLPVCFFKDFWLCGAAPRTTRSGSYWLTCLDATQGHRSRERYAELGHASWTRRQTVRLDEETEGVIQWSQLKFGFLDCCFLMITHKFVRVIGVH